MENSKKKPLTTTHLVSYFCCYKHQKTNKPSNTQKSTIHPMPTTVETGKPVHLSGNINKSTEKEKNPVSAYSNKTGKLSGGNKKKMTLSTEKPIAIDSGSLETAPIISAENIYLPITNSGKATEVRYIVSNKAHSEHVRNKLKNRTHTYVESKSYNKKSTQEKLNPSLQVSPSLSEDQAPQKLKGSHKNYV